MVGPGKSRAVTRISRVQHGDGPRGELGQVISAAD